MRITDRLGLPDVRGSEGLLAAILISSLGSGLFIPFSLLYFHVVVGLDLPTVGIVLSIAAAAVLPLAPSLGTVIDRFGARRAIFTAQVLQGLAFLSYLAVRDAWQLAIAATIATVGLRLFWPAYFTYLGQLGEQGQQDRWFGLASMLQNAGLGVGGLVAGLVVQMGGQAGYRAVVLANAVSFLVAALLVAWRAPKEKRSEHTQVEPGGLGLVIKDTPFLALTAISALLALCSSMLGIGFPVYAREALGVAPWILGAAFTLNTTAIVLFQTIVVRLAERARRTRALALAAMLWCGWSLLLGAALAVPAPLLVAYLLAVTILYTAAEAISLPTSSGLAADAARPGNRGRYMAVYQLSWTVANLVAPVLFALLFVRNPLFPWIAVALAALVSAAAIRVLEPRLPTRAVRVRRPASLEPDQSATGSGVT